ncbi:zinc finger SWIM domain-containing protein 1 [Dendropsophus ebraccatus]|uniref:zinc finger SWIM domain-containing protein 1 n=1 Tax=Dendropsophus ebraccatus TaxID=150705 RepID=UPI0038319598
MNPEFLQKLLAEDANSKVVCQVNKESCIDYVNLQTSTMSEVFSKFPEVLLIIRSHNTYRRALYTFVADGPRIGAPYEATRIVHVAVPSNETPVGLTGMFHIMKELNPCWTSIRVFLVDLDFTEVGAIHEAFPSVEVVPSASHVYMHVQQRIHELLLPEKTELILLNALKNTMCSATERNLKNLPSILQRFVDPGVLSDIKPGWLLTDRIWALHRWRSWEDSSRYFEMVESLSRGLNTVFNVSPFVSNSMNAVIFFILGQTAGKSQPELRNCSPEELALLIKTKGEASKKAKVEAQMTPEAAALMCESLHNICNPAAFGLCQNELEVTHKSLDLVGTNEDKVCVQILENPSEVRYGKCKTCTCGFYQSTELPCRHILSVLNANEEVLQPGMIHPLWQKQNNEPEAALPVTPDTLEIMKGEENDGSEKHLLVSSLTGQISALLAECSDEIFERRYNTLRELADAWIGPYEQVKL